MYYYLEFSHVPHANFSKYKSHRWTGILQICRIPENHKFTGSKGIFDKKIGQIQSKVCIWNLYFEKFACVDSNACLQVGLRMEKSIIILDGEGRSTVDLPSLVIWHRRYRALSPESWVFVVSAFSSICVGCFGFALAIVAYRCSFQILEFCKVRWWLYLEREHYSFSNP